MNAIYKEALERGREWSAKYAGVVHKPNDVIPVNISKPSIRDSTAKEKQRLMDRIKRTSESKAAKREKLRPKFLEALIHQPWTKISEISKRTGLTVQMCMAIAADCERAGLVRQRRYHESTWIATSHGVNMPLPKDDEYFVLKSEARKRNKKAQRERERQRDAMARKRTTEFIKSIRGGVVTGEPVTVWSGVVG